jgi:hypothetical protein
MKKFFSLNFTFSKLAKKLVYFLGFNFPPFLPENLRIDGDFMLYGLSDI